MLNKILSIIDRGVNIREVQAHCDIPCGIYDPAPALIACLTVIRMTDLIIAHKEMENHVHLQNEISRYIAEKERSAEIVKHEIRIIWGDFFKDTQFEKHPELHELTHKIMLLASKSRQDINKEAALELLDKTNRFAEIFWETKGISTKKVICPYPPSQKVVYPKL